LLEATERVARRVGFQAATTKEIASTAGVSIGTLYRYFPNKEALLAAVVGRHWTVGLHAFGERVAILKPGPFEDLIEDVVRIMFEMIASRREEFGKMSIELDNVVHLSAEAIEGAVGMLEAVLERRKAELRITDLRVASIVIVRTVVFLARVGARDHADLVASGRLPNEVAQMIRCYLVTRST